MFGFAMDPMGDFPVWSINYLSRIVFMSDYLSSVWGHFVHSAPAVKIIIISGNTGHMFCDMILKKYMTV